MKKRTKQITVCTHCRGVTTAPVVKHLSFDFCGQCAYSTGVLSGIERDPKKYGGHVHR